MPRLIRTPMGLFLALLGCALAGCSSVHSTYVPDGRRGFVVTCGGVLSNGSTCLIRAGRACGNHGYDVVEGTDEDRSMLIACKLPPASP